MDFKNKATSIRLLDFRSPQMRAFHMTWFAFFLCFFAWFGIAPLMKVIRQELQLTPEQVGNLVIGSVAITIVGRLITGWLCDRYGPRLTYTGLLLLGSLPVMGIGLSTSYESFLIFRVLIGLVGASFVVTQYHTSIMFAPNIVGTANATTAGWGNLGGGVTQIVMPLIFTMFIGFGFGEQVSWRLSMLLAGAVILAVGVAYFFMTQDAPEGNFAKLRAEGRMPAANTVRGSFLAACKDVRVWALFVLYAACFGIELTINNIAALYFTDYFALDLVTAGLVASLFGLMNIFARTLGGVFGDMAGRRWGLRGRALWLLLAVLGEGLALILFSQMRGLVLAVGTLVLFSLFVQMSEGATFSVVPFINKRALGSVAGIVGAGGNAGAVAAGFLFRGDSWPTSLLIMGVLVTLASFTALLVRFSPADELAAKEELETRLREREVELVPSLV